MEPSFSVFSLICSPVVVPGRPACGMSTLPDVFQPRCFRPAWSGGSLTELWGCILIKHNYRHHSPRHFLDESDKSAVGQFIRFDRDFNELTFPRKIPTGLWKSFLHKLISPRLVYPAARCIPETLKQKTAYSFSALGINCYVAVAVNPYKVIQFMLLLFQIPGDWAVSGLALESNRYCATVSSACIGYFTGCAWHEAISSFYIAF